MRGASAQDSYRQWVSTGFYSIQPKWNGKRYKLCTNLCQFQENKDFYYVIFKCSVFLTTEHINKERKCMFKSTEFKGTL